MVLQQLPFTPVWDRSQSNQSFPDYSAPKSNSDNPDAQPPSEKRTTEEEPPDGGYGWICVICTFFINFHTWVRILRSWPAPEGIAHTSERVSTQAMEYSWPITCPTIIILMRHP